MTVEFVAVCVAVVVREVAALIREIATVLVRIVDARAKRSKNS